MGAVITGHVYQYFAPVVVKETKTNRSFFSLFAMVPLYVVSFTHGLTFLCLFFEQCPSSAAE